jgi:hypothetical protein
MCVPLVPEVDANPSQRVLDDAFTEQIGKSTTFKAMRADGLCLGPLQVPKAFGRLR